MKYLFAGDIHNHTYMFNDIERLDNEYKFDKIIFFGDYVDDWNTTNIESMITLNRLFLLKESNYEKYILLLGNHEFSYLGYPCSGHRFENDGELNEMLVKDIDMLDFFTTIECGEDTYLCTHAGVTNDFLRATFKADNTYEEYISSLNEINKDKLKYLNLLRSCSYARGGSSPFSSFIWADKSEHLELNKLEEPIIKQQIIGHSPIRTININNDFIFIDTHSTYRDGSEFGDKSYLMWDEDKFKVVY